MHEWALAEGVISTILTVAKKKDAKEITEAEIKIGCLQQIDENIFTTAFRELVKHTPLEKTKIKLKNEEAYFKCRTCELEWNLTNTTNALGREESEAIHFIPELAHTFIRCPRCGSLDFAVTRGRGIWVEHIKILK